MLEIHEKYKILEPLGNQLKRKFGDVYLVQHKFSEVRGVMKRIAKNANNTHLQDRLRKEATFSFNFTGLPSTLDFFESDAEIVLIKNYSPGISLDEYWKGISKKNKQATLKTLLQKLLPIFNHLRENQIVHCDIKPSNIIIEQKGDQWDVSLIDFGMAVQMKEENDRKTLFPLGYAAPELLLNHLELVDHRTDIYSLGIVIWKLYTGKLPLTHPNPSIFTNLQLTHPLPNSAELPKGWYPILTKMCNKHPFRTAPNLLSEEEVKNSLIQGMAGRYADLNQIIEKIEELPIPKKWLFF